MHVNMIPVMWYLAWQRFHNYLLGGTRFLLKSWKSYQVTDGKFKPSDNNPPCFASAGWELWLYEVGTTYSDRSLHRIAATRAVHAVGYLGYPHRPQMVQHTADNVNVIP
jgi:hypothetical protein